MSLPDLIECSTCGPWSRVHRRVITSPGAIVDLGCRTWDWSHRFFGSKRVIGADPFELNCPDGAELHRVVVGTVRGMVQISDAGISSSTRMAEAAARCAVVEAITLPNLLERAKVGQVAALKMNIEGGEYELMLSMSEKLISQIDQIAVAFHDHKGFATRQATEAVIAFLGHWYEMLPISHALNWYLFLHR